MFYPSQDYTPIGSLKARYRPLGLVAQGQFGKVYCAIHRATGRLVALKLLDRQRSTTSQFLRELSSLLPLRHPAITQLWAIEQTNVGRCLVLDYSSGGTLRQLLESPVLPHRELMLSCLLQVLEGLAYAHDQGIVHCDVKPENILVQPTPQGWRACLTDFGIAQFTAPWDVTGGNAREGGITGCIPGLERGGSPAYMAPERFAGEAYRASDLYSVGIILYEVLLGDRPFHGSPNALREAHRQAPVKCPQPLALPFQKLLHQALSKAPHLRYRSAEAMAQALRQALLETSTSKTGVGFTGKGQTSSIELFTQHPLEAVLPWPEPSMVDWPLPRLDRSLEEQLHVGLLSSSPVTSGLEPPTTAPQQIAQRTEIAATPNDSGEPDSPPSLGQWPPQLWASWGANLGGAVLPNLESGSSCPWEWHSLESQSGSVSAIQDLVLGSSYGFALTRTALYRWPLIVKAGTPRPPPQLHCLLNGQNDLRQVALSPRGCWAAIAKGSTWQTESRSQPSESLLLLRLENSAAQHRPGQAPSARALPLAPFGTLLGIQLLDRRHGAALLTAPEQGQRLGLFSRRGQWLSTFALPITIQHWVRGTETYELWAMERRRPQILLRLTLKPFQLQRIPLTIVPDQICPTPWGCVVANQTGAMRLLNRDGQSLGQLQVPLPPDAQRLWLFSITPHSLLLGIQLSRSLRLLNLDLRRLGLMLVF